MGEKSPCVYIVANRRNGTIYVGVTSDLIERIFKHKNGAFEGFTKKYGASLLVYYELHTTMINAIEREKQIKSGSRKKKLSLIEKDNLLWRDLSSEI